MRRMPSALGMLQYIAATDQKGKGIMDYQAEIDYLRALQEKEQSALRLRKYAEWRELKAEPENWIWYASESQIMMPDRFTRYAGRPCVYLTKRLRPEVLRAWKIGGTGTLSEAFMDGEALGMCYILTDEGILTHEGGGQVILDTPRLCSPQEWEAICAGSPPAKFIR